MTKVIVGGQAWNWNETDHQNRERIAAENSKMRSIQAVELPSCTKLCFKECTTVTCCEKEISVTPCRVLCLLGCLAIPGSVIYGATAGAIEACLKGTATAVTTTAAPFLTTRTVTTSQPTSAQESFNLTQSSSEQQSLFLLEMIKGIANQTVNALNGNTSNSKFD
jgi:hypothetical protein